MKVACVVGTRPQFVKEAALSPVLRSCHEEILVNTGQHYDYELCAEQFKVLKIPEPDYNLSVGSGSHARQTAAMMVGLEDLFSDIKPGLVLLYGDTNSTLAGALAAAKLQLPIAHVEAGPRQYDMSIPEEVNRVVTDRLSKLRFAPTEHSALNLRNEGITDEVYVTGDVMYDIFLKTSAAVGSGEGVLESYGIEQGKYVLMTMHRPHNSDSETSLRNIIGGVRSNGEKTVLPLHPRTRANLERFGMLGDLERDEMMLLVKPVNYPAMVALMKNARIVVTDSGGVSKESFFCGVPCVSIDKVGAWPETVIAGWCVVTGADPALLEKALRSFSPAGERPPLFGDGHACEKIVDLVSEFESLG